MKNNFTVDVFNVPNMHCEHCVKTIKTSLKKIKEIKRTTFDLENKLVIVTLKQNIDPKILINAINEAGFEVKQ